MTLSDLCELVSRYYLTANGPSRILFVWTMHDEDGGLATVLDQAKTKVRIFSSPSKAS